MEKLILEHGVSYLQSLDYESLMRLYSKANEAYHNSANPIMSDKAYDVLYDFVESRYPNAVSVGSPILGRKTKLPFYMGSLNKMKSSPEKWLESYHGPYVISAKLDGVSALFDNRSQAKLYTRGDGEHGLDISHFIGPLGLNQIKEKNIVVRGECIIPKSFQNVEKKRNHVAGIVNSKTVTAEKAKLISFVPYEVVHPSMKPSEQMQFLMQYFPCIVAHNTVSVVNTESLTKCLKEWKEDYLYEIDGVVCTNNEVYPRDKKNPSHAFAFKTIEECQVAQTTVVDVLWNITKDGYLKPRVKLLPVFVQGVRIEYATAFNASYVQQNKLGKGSMIEVIRSGDVIPHIHKILQCSSEAKFPELPFEWNDTHIDIIVKDKKTNPSVERQKLIYFFQGLHIDGFGKETIQKVFEQGFRSIPQIIHLTVQDLVRVDGIHQKMATKICTSIQEKIKSVSLAKLLSLSNVFHRGIGEKKLTDIFTAIPDWFKNDLILEKVAHLKGFSEITAQQFVFAIPESLAFLKELQLEHKLLEYQTESPKSGKWKDKSFVFSGFRDALLEEQIKNQGGVVSQHLDKNTFQLIVVEKNKETAKTKKAKELGIDIVIKKNFVS